MFLEIKDLFQKRKKQTADFVKIQEHFEKHNSPLVQLLKQDQNADDVKKLFDEEDSFQTHQFVSLFKELHEAGREFFSEFMEKKKNTSALDIGDLLLFSLSLLRENPKTAQSFSKEWDYWLVDEYQDTSWVQEQIIDKITGFKNVFCVGDPAQSIYLFRGADPYVFKRRENALKDQVLKLDVNRRSSASLVHFYNDFFSENKNFMKFKPLEDQAVNCDQPSIYFFYL